MEIDEVGSDFHFLDVFDVKNGGKLGLLEVRRGYCFLIEAENLMC